MIRKILSLLLCIFMFSLAVSCTKTKDEIIKENKDLLNNIDPTNIEYDYQNNIGDWIKLESEYQSNEYGDNSTGIINLFSNYSNYILNNDRVYLKLARQNSTGTNLWAYISLITGEKHYICPDPLCSHTSDSGCQYLYLDNLIFTEDSQTLYSTKEHAIYQINLSDQNIVCIYEDNANTMGATYARTDILTLIDNNLYFSVKYTYKNTDNKELAYREEKYLKVLNLTTGDVTNLSTQYPSSNICVYASDDNLFFIDQMERCFYYTDMNYEDKRIILTFDENTYVYDMYYDSNTSEFYLLIGYNDSSDEKIIPGKLFVVDKNFICTELVLPSDKILRCYLTNNYIYYTKYDPVNYGVSPRGIPTVDENGNKIWRVHRDNPNEAELAFDGHGEIFWNDIIVVGEHLYIDYSYLHQEGDMVWWRRSGSTARINILENTIKWISLD